MAKRLLTTASHIPEMAILPAPVVLPKDGFSLPQRAACAARRRHAIPSVWMRAGTSKGLFIHRHHLPPSESEWAPILLSAMGSRNGDKRQLDGIGGATSTTSKVAVVSKSNRAGVDVDYTFAQVAPNEACVDMSGNCGNIASGVGPFALDEGLVTAAPGQTQVRIFHFWQGCWELTQPTVRRSNFQHQHKSAHCGAFASRPRWVLSGGRRLPHCWCCRNW